MCRGSWLYMGILYRKMIFLVHKYVLVDFVFYQVWFSDRSDQNLAL